MSSTTTINVLDSIMGSGKSTFIINQLRSWYLEDQSLLFKQDNFPIAPRSYLVVVPLLSEVDRFTEALPELQFKDPQPIEGRKLHHLTTLISRGENIVTTHSLFRMLTREVYQLLLSRNYVLIIDEVLDAVEMFDGLTTKDRDLLFSHNMVLVDPITKRLLWNDKDHGDYVGRFEPIKALCETGSLVMVRDSILIWEFPSEFFRCFKDVWVATYLFFGSPFHAYLLAEGFSLNMKTISHGQCVPWLEGSDEGPLKEELRDLITVYEGPANDPYRELPRQHPLSSSWFKRQDEKVFKKLKASTENFFKTVAKTPSHLNGWTTWSAQRKHLRGVGYTRNGTEPGKRYGFIPSNARATNDFREVASMAYLCNVFYHPVVRGYFEDQGVMVHEDLYALCQLVQWLWRSRIRCGKPITVFIPSERMRKLFKRWLATTSTLDLVKEVDPTSQGMLLRAA